MRIKNLQKLGELLSQAARLDANGETFINEETKSRKGLKSRVEKSINQVNQKLKSF